MIEWVDCLNNTVLRNHDTQLIGGFPEPFYKAPGSGSLAEVRFTRDYERSALHELGHWCIAGKQRRLVDDYDYWYVPDGRSEEQQRLFFTVEIKPQALEKYFCAALNIPFEVSVDNLGSRSQTGVGEFTEHVNEQYTLYQAKNFPPRATAIHECLRQWHTDRGEQGSH